MSPLKDGEVTSGLTDPPLLANDKRYVGQLKMTVGKVKNFSPVQRPTHNRFSQIFHCHYYQIVHKYLFNRFQ